VRTGFVHPDFSAPVNLAAQKTLVQSGATVKGMQLTALLEECQRRGAPIAGRRYTAFRDYPGEELLDLLVLAAGRAFPDVPCREGLRRLGHVAYPTLRESLVGRVVFGAVGADVMHVWGLVSKGYSVSGSTGKATLLELNEAEALLRLEGMYSFVDCWHVGIIEGAVEMYGFEANVMVKLTSPTSADLWVRWKPATGR
jgi:uncharacterized protein (TIGR02265 family)